MDPRLPQLPPREPAAVLLALSGVPNAPRVSLQIGGIAVRHARVLAVGNGVVLIGGAESDGPTDVRYVALDAIEQIVVHASAQNLHFLGFGAVPARPASPPPTSLELRRRAAALATEIAPTTIELALEPALVAEEGLHDVAALLESLKGALGGVLGSAEGIAALKNVKRVLLDLGPFEKVTLESGTLRITSSFSSGALRAPDKLREAIEALL